jgi:branched-chain amino acid transport system substrate-binding protein
MGENRRDFLRIAGSTIVGAGAMLAGCRQETDKKAETEITEIPKEPVKIAAVSFLTGVAAAPFGVPGNNTFKMLADKINDEGGILGRKIELIGNDEAGGVDAQVKLARKLILADNVDVILGYISSGDCEAVLPLSDEMGGLIIAYDCGTHKLMEGEKSPFEYPKYKLGFRSAAHLSIDNIGLALMVKKYFPNTKSIAGINPDYAWGRDSWQIFEIAMKKHMPQVKVVGTWWPPLFTTDYSAHISALMGARPDIVHTALWGGDTVTFTKQAIGLGLFEKMKVVYSRGEPIPQELGKDFPEEQIIGCAGPHYFLYPPHDKWPLNKWFVEEYNRRYGKYPTYPCYHAYQAIYSYKAAVEKAASIVGGWPTVDEIAHAMAGLSIETPSGHLAITENHDGVEDVLVGFTKLTPEYPFPILDPKRIEVFPADLINPPVGIRTEDWINSWKV